MRLPVEVVAQCNAALGQESSEFFGEFLQKHPLIFFRRFNLRPVRHIGNPVFVVHLLSKHHHVRIGAGPTAHPCINVTVAYGEFKSAALHAERRLNTRPESGLLHERRPVDVFDGFGFERKLHGIEMVGNGILLEKENRDKELPLRRASFFTIAFFIGKCTRIPNNFRRILFIFAFLPPRVGKKASVRDLTSSQKTCLIRTSIDCSSTGTGLKTVRFPEGR